MNNPTRIPRLILPTDGAMRLAWPCAATLTARAGKGQ